MGILQDVGLRRPIKWDKPTLLDEIIESPLKAIVVRLYFFILWLRGNPVRPPRNRPPIRVVCLSDTHEEVVSKVPDGDLLIHAGDMTNSGTAADIQKQLNWLASLPHRHKVIVCGNHDSWFDIRSRREEDTLAHRQVDTKGMNYLENESITLNFEGGRKLNIYGAPSLPKCGDASNAFQYEIPDHPWTNSIPIDTDILVTHTPPKYHLDLEIGCPGLLEEVWRVKPKVHVFGHVHSGRGKESVYWDNCQKTYESFMAREMRGPIRDLFPHGGWVDAVKILVYGSLGVVWQWVMQGGKAPGSLMINAGCQDGTKGRLNNKTPLTVNL